jgi:hypothetical protein
VGGEPWKAVSGSNHLVPAMLQVLSALSQLAALPTAMS